MKRSGTGLLCALYLTAGAMPAGAAPNDLPTLFGPRVAMAKRFPAAVAVGDFDGDGVPDQAYLVAVKPGTATQKLAPDVTVVSKVFGAEPLGAHGATLALAMVQENGKRKTLLTGYQGKDSTDFFASPMWTSGEVPLSLAKRGSKVFADFQRQKKAIRNDVLVVGTEAGIDTALYWTGKGYALFSPEEEP
jgi:hypothetical protein